MNIRLLSLRGNLDHKERRSFDKTCKHSLNKITHIHKNMKSVHYWPIHEWAHFMLANGGRHTGYFVARLFHTGFHRQQSMLKNPDRWITPFVQQVYGHLTNDKVIEDTFVFPDKVSQSSRFISCFVYLKDIRSKYCHRRNVTSHKRALGSLILVANRRQWACKDPGAA